MKPCTHCGKLTEDYVNYCDWTCIVESAKAAGGTVHTPNGLPICSVKHDNSMWEHEHGDHPDYKFPVVIEYVGPIGPEDADDYRNCCGEDAPDVAKVRDFKRETHALIYTDGSIAVTMYECCYSLWSLRDGSLLAEHLWYKTGKWRLSETSLVKIKETK